MAHRSDALRGYRFGIGAAMIVIALFVMETSWFFWFLSEPLPNAGGAIRRWMFLARAFPYVIPGVEPSESYFGMAANELSHPEFLRQRLPIVLASLLIATASWALGRLVLRSLRLLPSLTPLEQLATGFGLGAPLLGVLTLLVGRFGLIGPWPVRVGLAVIVLAESVMLIRDGGSKTKERFRFDKWAGLGFLVVTGPFLLTMCLGAMLPSIDYDAIEYHLQGPKEYFQAGQISFLEHNVYTSMPFSVEMGHLLGMEVLNDWWTGALAGQLLIAFHAPLTAVFIGLTALRFGSSRAAWFAAAVYLTTPWVYRLAILPYVEGPLCFYHAGLVWGASIAWTEAETLRRTRLWAVVGGLAGGAMACKYPALISAVIPFGCVAVADGWRRRSLAGVLAYSAAWGVVMLPWLLKNVVDTGNPVYPLGFNVFGGDYWDAAMDAKWSAAHGPKPISAALLWRSLVDVAGRSDWQSPLYLALAPLAFLRPGSRKFATCVLGLVAYIFLTWWLLTHRLDRFWLPLLPASALLAGLGADWTRSRAWSAALWILLFLATVTNLAYSTTALTGLNEWTGDLDKLRESVPAMLNPALAKLDSELPPEGSILLVGQAAVFHLKRPIIYNTVFDDEIFEQIVKDRTPELVHKMLHYKNVHYIYVDWHDIERFRSPGNYGFTDFVTQEVFDRLVEAKVLAPPNSLGSSQALYRVLPYDSSFRELR